MSFTRLLSANVLGSTLALIATSTAACSTDHQGMASASGSASATDAGTGGAMTDAMTGATDPSAGTVGPSTSDPVTSETGGSTAMSETPTSTSAEVTTTDTGPNTSDTGPVCEEECSDDLSEIHDCHGNLLELCIDLESCDPQTLTCANACAVAADLKRSVGCEYYATFMETFQDDKCFAVFIANTWGSNANITIEFEGLEYAAADFGYIPQGTGPSLTYQPLDQNTGIPPGDVAIIFLAGPQFNGVKCPMPPLTYDSVMITGSGFGSSFRISSDVPVVAFQINPYGGSDAATTGASLLLPTSVWGDNYVAVNAYQSATTGNPSLNIVAMEDATLVTMTPVNAVAGGGGVQPSPAGAPLDIFLDQGDHVQLTQSAELTGSVIQSDKPIGLMGGHKCMQIPKGVDYCDHGEQMIPPVRALGHEYVGVMHRPRHGEDGIWRIIGAVDDTTLTWSTNVGGPGALARGQIVEFTNSTPFVVSSQDSDHPFLLFNLMSGNFAVPGVPKGYGDPDVVLSYSPDQYMRNYVFFADPTYPETNLVVVRKAQDGQFADVLLDCAGALTGWEDVGDFQWTRVDLITGDFMDVGACSTGRHEIHSEAPFGLWVWGWGTPETAIKTVNVSYGYPGGMDVKPINEVVIVPG